MAGQGACIAVIGLAGRFPGARDVGEFWKNLRSGKESIRVFTEQELRAAGVTEAQLRDPELVRAGGFLADIDKFDAGFFGMSPRDAAVFDPQHRFFLEVAWEAFEDAGWVGEKIPGAVAVYAASGMSTYLMFNLLRNPKIMDSVGEWLVRHTGNDPDFLATRVSYELNLRGPSLTVQTACSSSLVAVHLACQSLLAGECDVALAGGSTIDPRQDRGYFYREGEILSPDGHCRPFDAAAQGTVNACATAAVVLKRLDDALRDGDTIRAVILGSAINNDGAQKVGYLAPSVEGQARVIAEALSVSGVTPQDISYLEAHGTGTLLGDPIELAGLQQAFGAPASGHRCAIGSVKSNIGHAGETASIVGLVKAVLALQHREIPPTVHFEKPNPRANLDGRPFFASGQLMPWSAGVGPRRAGVTGLGAGGTNAHVVLEEAPAAEPSRPPARAEQLLVVSARSGAAADAAAQRLAAHLGEHPGIDLADAAWTLQAGRKQFRHRRAVVCASAAEAALALRDPLRVLSGEAERVSSVAFLFPGGGAQYPRMAQGLYRREPVYRAAIDECLAAAPAGLDLRSALFPSEEPGSGSGPPASSPQSRVSPANLESPSLALPALFATEIALVRLLESFGIRPSAVMGHSAGEYAAACVAGVLTVADAMALVALRGRLFETLQPGGMLSVPLPEAELRALLPAGLDIAAVNGPSLCVAAGPLPALAALEARLSERGVESSRVHINVAAHSAMVEPILPAFEERARAIRFRPPLLPIVSNLTGTWADPSHITTAGYWVEHLRQPVRFAQGLQAMTAEPGKLLLEVGPGRTLSSLAKQQGAAAETTLRHPKDSTDDVRVLLSTLGRLWSRGAELDWERLQGRARRRVPLPTYPFEGKRHWVAPSEEQPAISADGVPRKRADVGEWFAATSWQRAAPPELERSGASIATGGPWLIFDRGDALGDAACRALQGGLVVRVRPGPRFERRKDGYRIRPESRVDLEALFADLRTRSLEPRRILHLLGAGRRRRGEERAAFQDAQQLYEGLVFLGQLFAASAEPLRLLVAVSGLCALGGEKVTAPERALLLGPTRVIPRELPNVCATLVDVEEPRRKGEQALRVARQLVQEALAAERGEVVALRGEARFLQRVTPLRIPPAAVPAGWARTGSAVLITGGLGGIGLALAEHLAGNARVRLALLGRTAPDESRAARVRALEAQGAEVLVLQADTGDAAQLKSALDAARRRFGRLDAVVHAAGVLDDLPIAARGDDPGRAVIRGKALGALLLDQLLAGDPPAQLVLFSSVSSLLGLPGQVDYTAANAYLDALAQARSGEDTRVTSISWNAWQEIGLAAATVHGVGPAHPLLGRKLGAASGEATYAAPLSREKQWVVGEHVIRGGEAVIPGTGILELFSAALGPRPAGKGIELRDVLFLAPFVVPAGAVSTAFVQLRAGELSLHAGSPQTPCATASGAFALLEPAPVHDLAALRARCSLRTLGTGGKLEQSFVDFGPRWSCVRRIGLGEGEALVELELPAAFAGDLADHPLHPALLDLATGSAQALLPGFNPERDFFVPLSYARVLLRAPLPARLFSHLRLRQGGGSEEMVFDAALFDEQGREVAAVLGYTLRRIGEHGLSRGPKPTSVQAIHAAGKPSATELALREGILPREGLEALDRILATNAGPHLIASSVDVAQWRLAAEAASAPRKAARAAGDSDAQGAGAGERAKSTHLAPRSETERELAALWTELLGVDRPGLRDNFFELGGESLIAVRMSVRLRRKFGVELPLGALFEQPTLAACAALLDRARGVAPPPPPDASGSPGPDAAGNAADPADPAASARASASAPELALVAARREEFRHLVCIEPGGIRLPLFCVHGAGGNVLNFRDLARGLDREQPFWGLQARGVDGRSPPHGSVEEAAAAYLAEVRTLQPRGPYLLAGYSGGGVIAFEMAQQITALGEEVSLLAFIDTFSPLMRIRPPDLRSRLLRLRRTGFDYFREAIEHRLRARATRRELERLQQILGRNEEVPQDIRGTQLFLAFGESIRKYVPKPWGGRALLFRAEARDDRAEGNCYGWDQVMPGRVSIVQVPGNHETLLIEPNATVVVRALHQAMSKAQPALSAAG